MQIYGGHGYIRENGMEQFVRDARIAQIYEGTNGIQALDLVGRKLPAAHRPPAAPLLPPGRAPSSRRAAPIRRWRNSSLPLAKAFARLQQLTARIAQPGLGIRRRQARRPATICASSAWWRWPICGPAWPVALAQQEGAEIAAFYKAKLATARFFMARVLPKQPRSFQMMAAASSR